MAAFRLSIHIFRRDLRLEDNSALLAALQQSEEVIPVYIFDDSQLSQNKAGNNSFGFMMNSLFELDRELREKGSKLYIFRRNFHECIETLLEVTPTEAVFVNRDYTPDGIEQDKQTATICKAKGVMLFSYADALLTEPEQVYKSDGTPYTVYTPFMKRARQVAIPMPKANGFTNYFSRRVQLSNIVELPDILLRPTNQSLLLKGGRKEGVQLLTELSGLSRYEEIRNYPAVKGTSLLSAHHTFGTISVRESFYTIIGEFSLYHPLINQLYWRDFFTHIGIHFPHVYRNPFNRKYDRIEWQHDEKKFEQWCNGLTGFPIVDAGIRELVTTGYMHNRVRMIVASFLTKDLHIDWRWGERFFADHLTDYDQAVNNGNWQWAASTGCDAQPWFRIFNPWSQQLKFDRDCEYIKRWVVELKGFDSKEIHSIFNRGIKRGDYQSPMVEHGHEATIAKEIFSKLK